MPWATLRKIFFCCCQESDDAQDQFNESSHLIPSQSVDSSVIYSNTVVLDHRKLQERLGHIVRTKESKMVNVASQVPFNLHNKVLPPERSYSRSDSGSIDQHLRDHNYQTEYGYSNHGISRQRNFYTSVYDDRVTDRSRSASPSARPIVGSSYLSQALNDPKPTPILNVRLVGYTDNMNKIRGRTRERQSRPTDMPDPVPSTGIAETSCEGLVAASSFKLRDVGPTTMSWND